MGIEIILLIISIFISIIWLSKIYKKLESMYEKIIFIMWVLVIFSPIVIFYLDMYNVPTLLGYNKNLNTQNWLTLISNYMASIISAIIGAVVLVYITMYQIKKNNEDNDKRDKENSRIQNMPLLKYDLTTAKSLNSGYIYVPIVSKFTEEENSKYKLYISVKNIGLNSVKKIYVKFESDVVNDPIFLLDKNTQIPIEKNETIRIESDFLLKDDSNYKISLNVYYEDVLNNWYLQNVKFIYNTYREDSMKELKFNVSDEMLIDKINL